MRQERNLLRGSSGLTGVWVRSVLLAGWLACIPACQEGVPRTDLNPFWARKGKRNTRKLKSADWFFKLNNFIRFLSTTQKRGATILPSLPVWSHLRRLLALHGPFLGPQGTAPVGRPSDHGSLGSQPTCRINVRLLVLMQK